MYILSLDICVWLKLEPYIPFLMSFSQVGVQSIILMVRALLSFLGPQWCKLLFVNTTSIANNYQCIIDLCSVLLEFDALLCLQSGVRHHLLTKHHNIVNLYSTALHPLLILMEFQSNLDLLGCHSEQFITSEMEFFFFIIIPWASKVKQFLTWHCTRVNCHVIDKFRSFPNLNVRKCPSFINKKAVSWVWSLEQHGMTHDIQDWNPGRGHGRPALVEKDGGHSLLKSVWPKLLSCPKRNPLKRLKSPVCI